MSRSRLANSTLIARVSPTPVARLPARALYPHTISASWAPLTCGRAALHHKIGSPMAQAAALRWRPGALFGSPDATIIPLARAFGSSQAG